MDKIRLGRTELMVSASGFGALPIQRISKDEAAKLLRKAYDNGINYFDTANMYTDSEEKIGYALSDVRQNIIISTKSGGNDKKTVLEHIELSLKRLKTDYIDIFQFHNPSEVPDPNDENGPYAAALEAKKKGWIRFIGITNHSIDNAKKAILSGDYDTLQFPFSSISPQQDIDAAVMANEHDMGFIAMKGLAGGLIRNAASTFAFIKKYPFVVPIWGVQREWELDQFLDMEKNPPKYEDVEDIIKKDRDELSSNFCHACGYCLPCPANIYIPNAARMSLLLRRAPYQGFINDENYEMMMRIEECQNCGACKSRCPYGLDTPKLLKDNLEDYKQFYAEHKGQ